MRVFSALLAASVSMAYAGVDEVGWAMFQPRPGSDPGCQRGSSTFTRMGNDVVFDLHMGKYDPATNQATISFDPVKFPGASGVIYKDGAGKLGYNVTLGGNNCVMDMTVAAGSVLGNDGKIARADLTYGVYNATVVAARSVSTDPMVCWIPSSPKTFMVNGNFAAVGQIVGTYDKAANKATLVRAWNDIRVFQIGPDGKPEVVEVDNTGKETCVFAIDKIYDGSVLGVGANTQYTSSSQRALRRAA